MCYSFSHPDAEARRAQFEAHFPYKKTNPNISKEDKLDAAWQKINEKIKKKNEKNE